MEKSAGADRLLTLPAGLWTFSRGCATASSPRPSARSTTRSAASSTARIQCSSSACRMCAFLLFSHRAHFRLNTRSRDAQADSASSAVHRSTSARCRASRSSRSSSAACPLQVRALPRALSRAGRCSLPMLHSLLHRGGILKRHGCSRKAPSLLSRGPQLLSQLSFPLLTRPSRSPTRAARIHVGGLFYKRVLSLIASQQDNLCAWQRLQQASSLRPLLLHRLVAGALLSGSSSLPARLATCMHAAEAMPPPLLTSPVLLLAPRRSLPGTRRSAAGFLVVAITKCPETQALMRKWLSKCVLLRDKAYLNVVAHVPCAPPAPLTQPADAQLTPQLTPRAEEPCFVPAVSPPQAQQRALRGLPAPH